MKNKYFYLTISFIVYNIIILIISNKYSLSIFFFLPMIFYTVYMVRTLGKSGRKNEERDSEIYMEEPIEIVGSTTYFEKKKTEEPKIQIGFDDVAGLEEIKEDLADIIDFLNNEEKYRSMDAKVPRGVLLYGPPGTGKTLIAKAIAGAEKAPATAAIGPTPA